MIHAKTIIRLITGIAALMLVFQLEGYSQGTDLRSKSKQKHFFLGFGGSAGMTNLEVTAPSFQGVESEKKGGFDGSFEIGVAFSRIIGISTGVTYSMFSSTLLLDNYANSYDTIDSEKESYKRKVEGDYINEEQKISFIKIPVSLNLHIPFAKSFGLYLQGGMNFSIPMQNSYNSTGVFSYSGFYKDFNVTIENIPYEGFLKNNNNNYSGGLTLNSMYKELFASAGFQINIKSSVQILFGGFYTQMLDDISDNPSTSSFRLSSKPNQMKSILQGTETSKITSMGLKLSFRFYL